MCTSWGIASKDFYLLHVLRKRMEYPELKPAVCAQAEAVNASVVLIEDKASGTQLIQELIDYGLHAVTQDNCRVQYMLGLAPPPRERWAVGS